MIVNNIDDLTDGRRIGFSEKVLFQVFDRTPHGDHAPIQLNAS